QQLALVAMPTPSRRSRKTWAVAALVGVAAAFAGYFTHLVFATRPSAQKQSVHVQRLTDLVGLEEAPAISPDGRSIAFVAVGTGKRQIWVRLLSGGSMLGLTKDDVDHYGPRWSAD